MDRLIDVQDNKHIPASRSSIFWQQQSPGHRLLCEILDSNNKNKIKNSYITQISKQKLPPKSVIIHENNSLTMQDKTVTYNIGLRKAMTF